MRLGAYERVPDDQRAGYASVCGVPEVSSYTPIPIGYGCAQQFSLRVYEERCLWDTRKSIG